MTPFKRFLVAFAALACLIFACRKTDDFTTDAAAKLVFSSRRRARLKFLITTIKRLKSAKLAWPTRPKRCLI
jgi:hypothetical protein